MIVKTTSEYGLAEVCYFKLLSRHVLECGCGGEKFHGPRYIPYIAKRAEIRKFMQAPSHTEMDIVYSMEHGITAVATAWRSGQMAKIGCLIFRGPEYRKLRKWALAK